MSDNGIAHQGFHVAAAMGVDHATRLGIEREEAEVIAAELDAAHMVNIGGGHSVTLTQAGRDLISGRKN